MSVSNFEFLQNFICNRITIYKFNIKVQITAIIAGLKFLKKITRDIHLPTIT